MKHPSSKSSASQEASSSEDSSIPTSIPTSVEILYGCLARGCSYESKNQRAVAGHYAKVHGRGSPSSPPSAEKTEDDDSDEPSLTEITDIALKDASKKTAAELAKRMIIAGGDPLVQQLQQKIDRMEREREQERNRQEMRQAIHELEERLSKRFSEKESDGHGLGDAVLNKLVDKLLLPPVSELDVGTKVLGALKSYNSEYAKPQTSDEMGKLNLKFEIYKMQEQERREQQQEEREAKREESAAGRQQMHDLTELARSTIEKSLAPVSQAIGDGFREKISGNRNSQPQPQQIDYANLSAEKRTIAREQLLGIQARCANEIARLEQAETPVNTGRKKLKQPAEASTSGGI